MMKTLRIVVGAVFVLIGVAMLVAVLRQGANSPQAIIAPLALMGAGALAISSARRKPKQW